VWVELQDVVDLHHVAVVSVVIVLVHGLAMLVSASDCQPMSNAFPPVPPVDFCVVLVMVFVVEVIAVLFAPVSQAAHRLS
jgi:hypothetical protein